jgi:hypothetical protein
LVGAVQTWASADGDPNDAGRTGLARPVDVRRVLFCASKGFASFDGNDQHRLSKLVRKTHVVFA